MEERDEVEIVWECDTQGDHWEAWLEGTPAHGHVQGWIYDQGEAWGNVRYRYGGGLNHSRKLAFAAIQGEECWGVPTLGQAQQDCLREMRRLRRWANDQGPESIEPLEWTVDGDGDQAAECHGVTLILMDDGDTWRLALHLQHGEPETEGYLWATADDDSDPMALGWTERPTEVAAKQFAQERTALIVRWLGGNPDGDSEATR